MAKPKNSPDIWENADEISPDTSLGLDDIFELIRTTNEAYLKIQAKKEKLKKETETLANKQKLIEPFRPLDGELDRILRYKYINYRFGRIPVEQYGRLEKYLIDDLGAIFVKGEQDESYLYGAYFCFTRRISESGCCIPFPAF